MKTSIKPAGHDNGKQTKEKTIAQSISHCERDPNYYA